ncbi:MAG: ABC transporter permease [Turicibacter sp.]|nr:ABC transporter permease [Turicibacter sp.]
MRKNIFVKSMLRQRIRTLLLFAIVATAVFAVVLRMAEYSIIDGHIARLAETYIAVGYLQGTSQHADISAGVDIIKDSPLIAFEDRRRFAEGVLHDIHAVDMAGMGVGGRGWGFGGERNGEPRLTYAVFHGTLLQMAHEDWPGWLTLQFLPYDIIAGFPEHVGTGMSNIWVNHWTGVDEEGNSNPTPVSDMVVGESYLVSVIYTQIVFQGVAGAAVHMPRITWAGTNHQPITLAPMNDLTAMFDDEDEDAEPISTAEFIENSLWFYPVPYGGAADFNQPELAWIRDRVDFLNHNQRAVFLQTTIDMYLMPQMIDGSDMRILRQLPNSGRLINHEDYLNANPVAVVGSEFARRRDLSLGDTITVTVPSEQTVSGLFSTSTGRGNFTEFALRGSGEPLVVLELEIVGIVYNALQGFGHRAPMYIHIPDSLLPETLYMNNLARYSGNMEFIEDADGEIIEEIAAEDFIMADRYSFILTSSRYEQTFYLEYSEILSDMGIELVMVWTGSGSFWNSADNIIMMSTFNAVSMWLVLILCFGLSSFIIVTQSRRNFAILRALGVSAKNTVAKMFACILVIILPAILVGAFASWQFTQTEFFVSNVEEILAYVTPEYVPGAGAARPPLTIRDTGVEIDMAVPPYLVVSLAAIFFAIMLTMVAIGAINILRRPVLEIIQGVKPVKYKKLPETTDTATTIAFEMPKLEALAVETKQKFTNGIQYIRRHIIRTPLKTALCLVTGIIFSIGLAWITQSIYATELEIEYLYETTVIEVQVFPLEAHEVGGLGGSGQWPIDRSMDDLITRRTIDGVRDTSFLQNIYFESAHTNAFLIGSENGVFPENWAEIIGFNTNAVIWNVWNMDALDHIVGVENLDEFAVAHTDRFIHGVNGSVSIEFADGFSAADFVYVSGEPIPVVASQATLEQKELELGEYVHLAYRRNLPIEWRNTPAVIIAVHNGHVFGTLAQDAMIVPNDFITGAIGTSFLGHQTLNFQVNPEYNDIELLGAIREEINEIVTAPAAGFFHLSFFMWDESLRNIVGALNQILMLLTLLQPIAVGVSVGVAIAIAMLLMLQNAAKAAIMSVLGASKTKIASLLCMEQVIIFSIGIILGFLIILIIGWNILLAVPLILMYFGGIILGSLLGSILVTMRPPLEMLQVRE